MVKKDKQSHEIRMIMIMTIANFLVLLDEHFVFVAVVVGMQLPIYIIGITLGLGFVHINCCFIASKMIMLIKKNVWFSST